MTSGRADSTLPAGATVLVTGANGFIGRHLLPVLANRYRVVAVARSEGPAAQGVEWVVHDLAEPLEGVLPARADAVVHLAQSRRYRDFPDGAEDVFAINVQSTFRLLEYARRSGTRSFVFTSTGGIYGYSYERFAETDPVDPLNFYFASKYSAELLIANYQRFFPTVVLRLFFVYGPGQRGMLVPTLIDRVERGETIFVDGEPGLQVNPIYVGDAVRVFEPGLAAQAPGLFNVAGDETLTITDLVRVIGEVTGRQPAIEYRPADRAGDLIGDNAQMRNVLGVVPRTPLREGLRLTVAERRAAVTR